MGWAELDQPLLGALANALTVLAYLPYIRSIIYGHTRPHVFSWLIWGLATGIAFLAVRQAQGGAGAWPIGISCLVSMLVAGLAYFKRADITITSTDWGLFFAALAAIPVWMAAKDPLWAVMLITLIELLGFGPTMRKTWLRPHSESMGFLVIVIVRNALIITALGQHTVTTMLFPAAAALACLLLVAIMLIRRPHVSP
ncbi:MAG: hypothetical protein ACOZB0_05600 [Pseudomonadota bacterium]